MRKGRIGCIGGKDAIEAFCSGGLDGRYDEISSSWKILIQYIRWNNKRTLMAG
jgi:hypothetical protein